VDLASLNRKYRRSGLSLQFFDEREDGGVYDHRVDPACQKSISS
jgi:hypothetical protein